MASSCSHRFRSRRGTQSASASCSTIWRLGCAWPIVFVHGLMVEHTLWQPVVPELSQGMRCCAGADRSRQATRAMDAVAHGPADRQAARPAGHNEPSGRQWRLITGGCPSQPVQPRPGLALPCTPGTSRQADEVHPDFVSPHEPRREGCVVARVDGLAGPRQLGGAQALLQLGQVLVVVGV